MSEITCINVSRNKFSEEKSICLWNSLAPDCVEEFLVEDIDSISKMKNQRLDLKLPNVI